MERNRVYGLREKARAMCQCHGGFLIGTLVLGQPNQVYLLQAGAQSVTCSAKYPIKDEVWDIQSCPDDSNLFSTVCNNGGNYSASLWRLPSTESEDTSLQELIHVAKLSEDSGDDLGNCRRIKWSPTASGEKKNSSSSNSDPHSFVMVSDDGLSHFSLESDRVSKRESLAVSKGSYADQLDVVWGKVGACAWDAFRDDILLTACGKCVSVWDMRSKSLSKSIPDAHVLRVRDVDSCPWTENVIVTGGDDCECKVWDLRHTSDPLIVLEGHTHWVWATRFNEAKEGFLLSSGSDSLVKMWEIDLATASAVVANGASSPQNADPSSELLTPSSLRTDDGCENEHRCLGTLEDHDDSVYEVAWSTSDPWTFASLSYQGRVVVTTFDPSQVAEPLSR